jgi:stage II sporulation protein AB (anti-sigma F factor)
MNRIKIEFDAISENEAFARVCIAAFVTRLDPTLDEINDVKTAVSEAVTNAIIHGYDEKGGTVVMEAVLTENLLELSIVDFGKGIENIELAKQPMYTTGANKERSGMGFTFMEIFMDELIVESKLGVGTTICMKKRFNQCSE